MLKLYFNQELNWSEIWRMVQKHSKYNRILVLNLKLKVFRNKNKLYSWWVATQPQDLATLRNKHRFHLLSSSLWHSMRRYLKGSMSKLREGVAKLYPEMKRDNWVNSRQWNEELFVRLSNQQYAVDARTKAQLLDPFKLNPSIYYKHHLRGSALCFIPRSIIMR